MFERLSDGFSNVFRKLSGKGTISESNVREAMSDVRSSLLEADVHVDVVDAFVDAVTQDAVGRNVTKSLEPGQEMIGIVHDRLVEFLGGTLAPKDQQGDEDSDANNPFGSSGKGGMGGLGAPFPNFPKLESSGGVELANVAANGQAAPTIIMMCGLQGSGKTTTCGKLAALLKKRGRSTMLVAADLQRPAAVEQLHTVADHVNKEMSGGAQVTFYSEPDKVAAYGQAVGVAVQVCKNAIAHAKKTGVDTVILDTAGRLHVNDALMDELQQVVRSVQPHQIFLVVDAMTGQDAVNSAKQFNQKLERPKPLFGPKPAVSSGIDGIILTKFDSDTRGGAAISVKHVTGAPIAFIGVGEKLDALEAFHPERIATRILGMGDVVSLVEKAREQVSEEDAQKLQEKMEKGEMTMDDFLKQLRTLRRMGPMKQLLGLLPGVGSALKDVHIDDKQLDRVEAIVSSMTPAERKKPDTIDNSRARRIGKGSGTNDQEVRQLTKQFSMISKLAKGMANMGAMDRVKAVKELGGKNGAGMAGMVPGMEGLPMFRSKGSTATPSIKSKFKKRK
jgi:signal recognition particle subunit SRP54